MEMIEVLSLFVFLNNQNDPYNNIAQVFGLSRWEYSEIIKPNQ